MKKRICKRIFTILLTVLVSFTSMFSGACTLYVKAAMPLALPLLSEMSLILYELLGYSFQASGTDRQSFSYDEANDLVSSFLAFSVNKEVSSVADMFNIQFELTGGDIANSYDLYQAALQLNFESLISEADWALYQQSDGDFSFDDVVALSVDDRFFNAAGTFVRNVFDGLVPEVSIDNFKYLPSVQNGISTTGYYFNADAFDINADLFTGNGDVLVRANNGVDYYKYTFRDMRFVSSKSYPLFVCVSPTNDGGIGISFYNWVSDNTYYSGRFCSGTLEKYAIDTGLLRNTVSCNTDTIFVNSPEQVLSISFDIPIVADPLDACAFFQNGDTSGILNGPKLDSKTLASAVATTMAPLIGLVFSPNKLGTLGGMLGKAVGNYVVDSSDIAANTDSFSEYFTTALAESLPDAMEDTMIDTTVGTTTTVLGLLSAIEAYVSKEVIGVQSIVSWFPAIDARLQELIEVIPAEVFGVAALIEDIPATVYGQFAGTLDGLLSWFPAIDARLDDIISIFPAIDWAQIESQILTLPRNIADALNLADVLAQILSGVLNIPEVLRDLLAQILAALAGLAADVRALPLALPVALAEVLALLASIADDVRAIAANPSIPLPGNGDGGGGSISGDLASLLNGLILLILILIQLLLIFLHCLDFIVSIFNIAPTTGYLPDEMVMGLNYLKTLMIPNIGMSVYDFMMGLVYILLVFSVVKLFRKNVDRIRIPKQMNGV